MITSAAGALRPALTVSPRRSASRGLRLFTRPRGGRKTTGSLRPRVLGNDMQLCEYPSVHYWSKEINGTLPGGLKK